MVAESGNPTIEVENTSNLVAAGHQSKHCTNSNKKLALPERPVGNFSSEIKKTRRRLLFFVLVLKMSYSSLSLKLTTLITFS